MSESMDPAAILKRVDETEKDVREQLKLGSHIKGVRPPSSVLINPEWLLFLCTILRPALADTRRMDWIDTTRQDVIQEPIWDGDEPRLIARAWGVHGECDTVRGAIDAAIAAPPRETNHD